MSLGQSTVLSDRQQRFVEEYLISLNATQAYCRAGYSAKTANNIAFRLLRAPKIHAAISAAIGKLSDDQGRLLRASLLEAQERGQVIRRLAASKPGFVYFIEEEHGLTKIGSAISVSRRLRALATPCPYALSVRLILPTEDRKSLERSLHERFASRRVRGEWFRIAAADLEAVANEFQQAIDPPAAALR